MTTQAKMEIQDGGAIIVVMGDGTLGGAAIDIKSGKDGGLLAYGIAQAMKDKAWREGIIEFAKRDEFLTSGGFSRYAYE